jgi:uncharacterized membrane protein
MPGREERSMNPIKIIIVTVVTISVVFLLSFFHLQLLYFHQQPMDILKRMAVSIGYSFVALTLYDLLKYLFSRSFRDSIKRAAQVFKRNGR